MPEPQGWTKAFSQNILPLRFKMVIVIFLYALFVLGIGIYINKYFRFMELDNFGLNKYNDNAAEILRNIIWTIGFLFGGFLAVLGFMNSIHRTQQKDWELEAERYKTIADQSSRNRQIDSEIFAKSVEHLGHEKQAVRLGGLYALENLARSAKARPLDEDNKAYLLSLLETFSACVREYAPIPSTITMSSNNEVSLDASAAIQIISRTFNYELRKKINARDVDVQRTYLPCLPTDWDQDLSHFNFAHSILDNSHLRHVNFTGSSFYEASLQGATLQDANMDDAELVKTVLSGAVVCTSSENNQIINWDGTYSILNSIWDPANPPQGRMRFPVGGELGNVITNRTEQIREEGLWEKYLAKQKTKER